MREFVANKKEGKKLYRKCRKNYKRYKIGSVITWLLIAAIIFFDITMVSRGESTREMAEIMIVCLCFDIVFGIGAAIVWAAAISGGREVLMNRLEEKCTFFDDHFEIDYVPNPAIETSEYKHVVFKMFYEDAKSVDDELNDHGRLAISGKYEILKDRSNNTPYSKVEKQMEYDLPLSVYAYYTDFQEMYEEFRLRLGEKFA